MTATPTGRGALRRARFKPLAGALALTFFGGISAHAGTPLLEPTIGQLAAQTGKLQASPAGDAAYYTIVFKEPALAGYDGGNALFSVPERTAVRGKLDVNAPEAIAYVSHLQGQQEAFLNDLGQDLRRPLQVTARMQHALNAVIVGLTDEEAAAVALRDDVLIVERERLLELDTYTGPAFIGATDIWNGFTASGLSTRGENIVVGIVDTGINWESPAFAAVSPADGYVHQNPRGAGTFLGNCAEGQPDEGHCNDKLIGIYNFAEAATGTDGNGHGTHTASTAAGNPWDPTFANGTFAISGVAPRANIIAYKACISGCTTTATSQSVNQAVIDGVDVLNYSISGGTSPWTDTTSIAFRNAVAAGMFVAASAGNTSAEVPDPQGQVNHLEPWVETVAASTHDGTILMSVSLTSEASPPANTQNIGIAPGAAPLPTESLVDVPIIKSPNFANGSTDGCSAYPAGTFIRQSFENTVFQSGFEDGELPGGPPAEIAAVAVLHLDADASACASGARRTAALNAGAIGVIFVDDTFINLGANNTSWSMPRADWDNIEAAMDPATATVTIDVASQAFPGTGDTVAGFSFRGPRSVGGQVLVKPDITGPGVNILAAGAAAAVGADGVYLNSGTSMSSPHLAGAAALLRALQPTWTPAQIKSAMNLTANNFGAVNQDGSAIRAWDYGSGRVNLSNASNSGLIMDETLANYIDANPATGGDLSTLNLPSMSMFNGLDEVSFTRTFRRARTGTQTYAVSTSGFPAGSIGVTPTEFTVNTTGVASVTVTVQTGLLNEAEWTLGELTLAPQGASEPVLNLPIAVFPGGPQIEVDPGSLSGTSDATVANDLTISNIANPTLNWGVQTTGMGVLTPFNTGSTNSGQLGGVYTETTPTVEDHHWSQNFDVDSALRVTTLRANGFTLPGGSSLSAANTPSVLFSIYADNAGSPAGAPGGFGDPPLWTFSGAISAANGISTLGGNLALDLNAPNVTGTPLNLTPGRYWLTVTPTINSNKNPLWAWRASADPQVGAVPKLYAAFDDPTQFQTANGLAMFSGFVQGEVDCNLPFWVDLSASSGALGFEGEQTISVTFDAFGLPAGTYTANLCITSNASNAPLLPVPLSFTVPTGTTTPGVAKAFSPDSIVEDDELSTLTITLSNPSAGVSTLTSDLVDALPSGLVVAPTPNAATDCAGGSVTAVAGEATVTLGTGAQIPTGGSCTVTVDIAAATPGEYDNVIPAGGLQTDTGNSLLDASATLEVLPVCLNIDGAASNDELGDPSNTQLVLDIGAGNSLTGIAFDVSITAFAPSWRSETVVRLTDSTLGGGFNFQPLPGLDSSGTSTFSSGGVLATTLATQADGELVLRWWDIFDDTSATPDAQWFRNSPAAVCPGIRLVCSDQAACDAAVRTANNN